jgi:hypothetical protein
LKDGIEIDKKYIYRLEKKKKQRKKEINTIMMNNILWGDII